MKRIARWLGRTRTEQKQNAESLAWEIPRGRGASAKDGRDGEAREQLAARMMDRRAAMGLGLGGLAAAGVLGFSAGRASADLGDGIGGTHLDPNDIVSKRIAGVRIATEFDAAKHTGTSGDPYTGVALTGAIADGKAIFMPGVRFRPTSHITGLDDGHVLFGVGEASEIYNDNFSESPDGTIQITGSDADRKTGVRLMDFKLTVVNRQIDAITIDMAEDCMLSGLILSGIGTLPEEALAIYGSRRMTLDHLRVSGFGSTGNNQIDIGEHLSPLPITPCEHVLVSDSHLSGSIAGHGLQVRGSRGISVNQVHVTDPGLDCFSIIADATAGVPVTRDIRLSNILAAGAGRNGVRLGGQTAGVGGGHIEDVLIDAGTIRDSQQRGVIIEKADKTSICGSEVYDNGQADSSNTPGIFGSASALGEIVGLIIADTRVYANSSPATPSNARDGVMLFSVKSFRISSCEIFLNGRDGIGLSSCQNGVVMQNEVYNNRQVSAAAHGINIYGAEGKTAENILVYGNLVYDDQGSPTQQVGLREATAYVLNNAFWYNRLFGNTTAQVLRTSASLRGNIGYASENNVLSGTFTIDSTGLKTVVIAHGLAFAPAKEKCALTVLEETNVDDWAYNLLKVDSVDGTNVTVKLNVSTQSGTGGATARIGLRVGEP